MKLKTIILVVNPCVTKGKTFSSFPWFLSQMIRETVALNLWPWKETFHLRFLYSFFPGRKVIKRSKLTNRPAPCWAATIVHVWSLVHPAGAHLRSMLWARWGRKDLSLQAKANACPVALPGPGGKVQSKALGKNDLLAPGPSYILQSGFTSNHALILVSYSYIDFLICSELQRSVLFTQSQQTVIMKSWNSNIFTSGRNFRDHHSLMFYEQMNTWRY